jgi:hypothetical protein
LNPLFGKMADIAHIATFKDPICSPGAAADPDYMSVADASGNLP